MIKKQQVPSCNIAKFSCLQFAVRRSLCQKYWVEVIMGEDGLYWVASTRREVSILKSQGLKVVGRA